MELFLALAVVVVVVALLVFRNSTVKGLEVLDVNKDGKVDVADVEVAVTKVKTAVKAKVAKRSYDKNTSAKSK